MTPRVAVLLNSACLDQFIAETVYITPLSKLIPKNEILTVGLTMVNFGKPTAVERKTWATEYMPQINTAGITLLMVCDGEYFKYLAGVRKVRHKDNKVFECKLKGYEHIRIVYSPMYTSLKYNPINAIKITEAIETVAAYRNGTYVEAGLDIVNYEVYPEGTHAIAKFVTGLHEYPILTCDIEAFSLDFTLAGIGTVGFAWDEHHGGAFLCDYMPIVNSNMMGVYIKNDAVHEILRTFFLTYTGTLIFHNISYDVKVLVFELFMFRDLTCVHGLIDGVEILAENNECTKVLAYLGTNNSVKNTLDLKSLALPYTGDYGILDTENDIRFIPPDKLLKYNLVDCLATWYVFLKYYPIVYRDNQLTPLHTIFKPSIPTLIQQELHGMPVYMPEVIKADKELEEILVTVEEAIHCDALINHFSTSKQWRKRKEKNATLKTKVHGIEKFSHEKFNPASPIDIREYVYEYCRLPVIYLTDKKMPSTKRKVLVALSNAIKEAFGITPEDLK